MTQTSMVLAPFHALSCPEILDRTVQSVKSGFDNVVRAGHVDRPIGVREAKGLFWLSDHSFLSALNCTYPPAPWLPSHSRTYRSFVPVCCARAEDVTGPLASSLYKPSRSPTSINAALIAAPRSPTALPRNSLSFVSLIAMSGSSPVCRIQLSDLERSAFCGGAYPCKISDSNWSLLASQQRRISAQNAAQHECGATRSSAFTHAAGTAHDSLPDVTG